MIKLKNFLKLGVFITVFIYVPIFSAAPYQQSNYFLDIIWDFNSHKRTAQGSDNWAITWADDDNQYATWGDGWGFEEGGSKTSLGVSKISGSFENYIGTDTWRNGYGKSYGIICIQGILYMWYGPGSNTTSYKWTRITKSTDYGESWTDASWQFNKSSNLVMPTICNFGQDYNGARDDYVYTYFIRLQGNPTSLNVHKPGKIDLARVQKDHMMDSTYYEFVTGFDGNGNPIWDGNYNNCVAVFEDPDGVGWCFSVIYNAGLKRYILCTEHSSSFHANFGFFEASEPWGPWKTIKYYNNWGSGSDISNASKSFYGNFSNKWTSADGKDFVFVCSGIGDMDSWNVIKGSFDVAPLDSIPPTAPAGLNPVPASDSRIDLNWNPSSDNETGIAYYKVYRNDSLVGTSTDTIYSDTNLSESTLYSYAVSAVNGSLTEGNKSGSAEATTFADTTAPSIISTTALGEATSVIIVFSEPVRQTDAENTGNFNIDNSIDVISASLTDDSRTVTLSVSPLIEGITYTLSVDNIYDNASIPNKIADNTSDSFNYIAQLTISFIGYNGTNVSPTVVDSGFVEGAAQCNDRSGPPKWTNVPLKLTGCTYLLTSRSDKNEMLDEDGIIYIVNSSSACTVFVLFDVNDADIPKWIASDRWENTGLSVTGSGDIFGIYKKYFTGGQIHLKRQLSSSSEGTSYVFKLAGSLVTTKGYKKVNTGNKFLITICPNPFNHLIIIQLERHQTGMLERFKIYGINGKIVGELSNLKFINSQIYTWNIHNLSSGIYIAEFVLSNKIFTKKFIIDR
ncbi:MAG: T9SS type A sorting domain-containing protein [Chitinispirillia bacterium]|jgi:hypothetical protein